MSLLDALERQRQRRDERTAAIAAAGTGIAQAHAVLEAARTDIKALESGIADAGRRMRRALLVLAAAVALLALVLVLVIARRPPEPAVPMTSVISVPFPVVVINRNDRDDTRAPASLTFEPDGNWAFRTRDATLFANCGNEEQALEMGTAPWRALSGARRQLKLADLIQQEHEGLVAIVVEAGHDARRVLPGARLADNAALARQRTDTLEKAVRAVLGEIAVAVPVIPVARGASDEDASARCRDRQPRLTLIKHTTRGVP